MRHIEIPGIRRLLRVRTHDALRREIEDEIHFHIESRSEELIRLGVSREEARQRAETEYGDAEASRNELLTVDRRRRSHDQRDEVLMSFIEDIRYAARGLARRPALLTVTTTALCIGIAANSVMFGVVDQLLLRPPAHVTAPDGVKRLYYQETRDGETGSQPVTNYPLIASLQKNTTAFSDIVGLSRGTYSLGGGEEAASVDVQLVTGNYFRMLGVRAALGRTFAPGEDTIPLGARVAVLSHGFWTRELGGVSDVIGRQLYVNGKDYVVIGVAPKGFSGIDRLNTDLWVPISAMAPDTHSKDWYVADRDLWVKAIGRVRPGVSAAVAASQATAVFRAQLRELKQSWRDSLGTVVLGSVVGTRTPSGFSPEGKVSLWLMGVSIVVLLIACANVTNLLIARMVERRREIALRLALGISRSRLMRMLLTESILLAVLAAAAALVLSFWASRLVQQTLLPGIVWSNRVIDTRVLVFTLAVTLLCIVLAGAAPALQSIGLRVAEGLKAGAHQVAGSGSRLRHALLSLQAALSVVLLIGAGLFVRSLHNVTSTDVGIDLDRVLLVEMLPES
jgi:putative ABC transport system permease protein